MTKTKAIVVIYGCARNQSDEDRLLAKGVKKIRRIDTDLEAWGTWKMRRGETLGVVDGFRVFGVTRKAIMEKVRAVHGWGAVAQDMETGCRSDVNGAEMLDNGLAKRVSETRAPDTDRARTMQKASVKSRMQASIDAGERVSAREASYMWHHSPHLKNEEIAEETGWPATTMNHKFGKRRLPPGRRKKVTARKKRA